MKEHIIQETPLAVPGFLASAVPAGLKKSGKDDLALIVAPSGAQVSVLFTQSQVVAAPVMVSREHAADQSASALIINAGNANACTGQVGTQAALDTCQALSAALGIESQEVLVASTGVIGVELPIAKIIDNLEPLIGSLCATPEALQQVANAIMTTDLVPKIAAMTVTVDNTIYTVTGIAKGSGMVAPNMATVICCVLTDAPLSKGAMAHLFADAIDESLNCMSVDGDTSTNDTAVLMSSGAGLYGHTIDESHTGFSALKAAITQVCIELARTIAKDGEGATKLIDVTVSGALTDEDARTVALTIANSPLVKTALFGNDANWGRVAAAAGRAGISYDQSKMAITIGGIEVCKAGTAVPFCEDQAFAALDRPEVEIHVDLGVGEGHALIWTCDLSYDYVKINGEYRS
ncbi:MAG: bifunctional glutamate N-acetyltransferase/amino-acid acetyltransferase ArgJ [Coriobacteriia bacterium]|nr:bifunctional glutamate N-acetyltransferase/amino-acid acetyltransferase ArgJ [Coriobacteriia bacterium]